MRPRGTDKAPAVSSLPLPPIPLISHSLWLTECQTLWHFSSLTPVLSYYQVQIVLLVSAILKIHVLKSSLGCRRRVGFNDSNMHVFVFKEVNRRDEYINSLIFFSFFLLCLRMMNTERLSTQFPLKYNSFIALKRLFTPTRLKAFPSLSAVGVQL